MNRPHERSNKQYKHTKMRSLIAFTKRKRSIIPDLSREFVELSVLNVAKRSFQVEVESKQQRDRKKDFFCCYHPGVSKHVATTKHMSTATYSDTIRSGRDNGPFGDLFLTQIDLGAELIGKTGCIHRTFGPRDNSDTILATGGEALAAHASFDPNYKRAQGWIRKHAVGPAVLSPILLQGLIGALSEAAFPEGVLVSQSMMQLKPLIVGVAVKATIEVIDVKHSTKTMHQESGEKNGYMITLRTDVSRARDDELIVEGNKLIWIPDYENM